MTEPSRFDPSFLRAVVLVCAYKAKAMERAEVALLCLALTGREFTAANLTGEITRGSRTIAGCATGALASMGLIACVGRCKSPNPAANGRRLDVWRLADGKGESARTLLRRYGVEEPPTIRGQGELW